MRRALLAEWTKLRTLPSNAWTLLALTVLMTAGAAVVVAATDVPGCRGEEGGCPVQDTTALMLMGVHVAQIAAIALAAAAICAEFQPRLIRTTFAMKPQRGAVFVAKALVVCGAVLVTALAGTVAAILVGRPAMTGKGLTPQLGYTQLSLSAGALQRAALGTVLYLMLVALLTVGIAAAVRHVGAAIGIAVTALYGPYMVTVLVPMSAQALDRIQDASPLMAGLAVQTTVAGTGTSSLAPWSGLGVLAAYAVGALLIGGVLFARRDV
ncbi:ABC transporter permease [Micromonospora chersina]|uniref:ABC transporter permease n=1 Tax=Micromonospora chersina TaxID=47854 RepID=UPI0037140FE1